MILTAGELYALPVWLGRFGRLSPRRLGATFIAAWFLAAFGGNLFAGFLGTFWTRLSHGAFFSLIGIVAGVSSALFHLLRRPLQYLEIDAEKTPGEGRAVATR